MTKSSNGGPPCPNPTRVRELIDLIDDESEKSIVTNDRKVCADLIDALDWLATMLENRSLYHKKQQIKNKIIRSLAREHGLEDQANIMTNESLHEFVSSQPVDRDEIDIEFPTPEDTK